MNGLGYSLLRKAKGGDSVIMEPKRRAWVGILFASFIGGVVGVEIYTVVELEIPSVFSGGPFLWEFLLSPALPVGVWAGIVAAIVVSLFAILSRRLKFLVARLVLVAVGAVLGAFVGCITTFFLVDSWVYVICVSVTVAVACCVVTIRSFAQRTGSS